MPVVSVRRMLLCRYSIPISALLYVYNHVLTFTKLATSSASVVKSNLDNFWRYKSLGTPIGDVNRLNGVLDHIYNISRVETVATFSPRFQRCADSPYTLTTECLVEFSEIILLFIG